MKNKSKILFTAAIFLGLSGWAGNILAAPAISDAPGTAVDYSTLTLSGAGFGENSALGTSNLQWLGSNIEAGNLGNRFTMSNWVSSQLNDGFNFPLYSNAQAHSGTQSIECNIPYPKWGCYYEFDHGQPITSIYMTMWVRIHPDPIYNCGQWKMWRLEPTYSPTDQNSTLSFSNWIGDINTCSGAGMKIPNLFIDSSFSEKWPPPSTNGKLWLQQADYPLFDEWARMEVYAVQSDANQSNGTVIFSIMRDNGTPMRTPISYAGNLMTNTTGSGLWRWFISPHYCGDGLKCSFWSDDTYVQFGTQARVELCDSALWANRTHCEIQPPVAWADNNITITLNKGSFSENNPAYLYVVDQNGNANADGYSVTLVSDSGDTTPPDKPSGLSIN